MDLNQIWGGLGGLIQPGAGITSPLLAGPAPELAFWPQLIKVLVCLSALLGALLLALFIWKRWVDSRPGGGCPLIKVLATRYLAPKKALLLVGVGEEKFLLASAGDHVTLITALASREGEVPAEVERPAVAGSVRQGRQEIRPC